MSTYYDKKKLIDDNSDLYISDYDKALPSSGLGGIIEAKRSYDKAKAEGHTKAMQEANSRANAIRTNTAGYTGGKDGSEYQRAPKPYEIRINDTYSSPYEKDRKRLLNQMSEKREFSYDPQKDPIFEVYKNLYTKLGDEAYDRALSENALRTGGMVSTSAQSAAMQAKNHYNSMISAKIPELYEASYDKYLSEYERLYRELELLSDLDDREYKRHRDKISDWEKDREYYSRQDENAYKNLMDMYEFDSELAYDIAKDDNEMQYQKDRDDMKDYKWITEFEADTNSDAVKSAINLAKIVFGKPYVSTTFVDSLIDMLK